MITYYPTRSALSAAEEEINKLRQDRDRLLDIAVHMLSAIDAYMKHGDGVNMEKQADIARLVLKDRRALLSPEKANEP